MQDLTGKITGGTLTAAEWNQLPQEVQNIITDLGITLSGGDFDQLGKAMAGFLASGDYYSESGAANAYVCSVVGTKQGPTDYIDGMIVRFRAGNANTGASTVNVNSLGAKSIVRETTAALEANDIVTASDTVLRFDAAEDKFFVLFYSMIAVAPSALGWPPYFITGFPMDGPTGTTWEVNIGMGSARAHTTPGTTDNTQNGAFESTFTKDLNGSAWAAGTAANGLANGATAKAASNWYATFLMVKSVDGSVDIGFDSSPIATNLKADSVVVAAGFDRFRFIGWVQVDGSNADVEPFFYNPDNGLWQYREVRDLSLAGTDETLTLDIPEGDLDVIVSAAGHLDGSTQEGGMIFRNPAGSDAASGDVDDYVHWAALSVIASAETNSTGTGMGVVRADSSKQIYADYGVGGAWQGALRGFYVRREDR